MKNNNKGFTLIELMIAVAIIGILASIALPAYQDFIIRARITEGLGMVTPAKIVLESDVRTLADLVNVAGEWNNQSAGTGANSKYVSSILMNNADGEITITYNPGSVGIKTTENTLVLSPWSNQAGTVLQLGDALTSDQLGSIDWSCASTTTLTATNRGMIPTQAATLLTKFAPATCR